MAAESIPVPDPRRQDIEDVQCALAVAAARWEHGDREDALRWLRRAARAAADHNQLERALELSKAAAEMSRRLSQPPPPPRRSRPAPRGPRPVPRAVPRAVPSARLAPPPLPRKPPLPTRPDVPAIAPRAKTMELPTILDEDDDEDPTVIRLVPSQQKTRPDLPAIPAAPVLPAGPLSAARVAVMHDPITRRPTMVVLPPHAAAPPGSAVAMLVASTSEDTARLSELLEDFVLEDPGRTG